MEKRFISTPQFEGNLGFVLLTTILMLMLLSSLILTLWQGVLQFWRIYNVAVKEHTMMQSLESASAKIQQLYRNSSCIIEGSNPNTAIRKLHSSKCHILIKQIEYGYNFTKLASYPCLQLQLQNKWHGTQHWLLTLQMLKNPEEVLQLRIAIPVQGLVCIGSPKTLEKSLLNWRYLHVGDLVSS